MAVHWGWLITAFALGILVRPAYDRWVIQPIVNKLLRQR